MRCGKCGNDNREGRRFCAECGSALAIECAKCGASNEPGEKFCGHCGVGLGAPVQTPVLETSPVPSRDTGERRHLTVLFCDLVGSTQIAAKLDPEEWRETVACYHRAAADAITRFGGHVAKYLGDGVMAFFGYPEAHDNNAERAARAGLAILDAVVKLNERPGRHKLATRVGIHSGAVVVGAGAGKDADAFGDAPNVAARVQEAAATDTVAITDDTHRLVSGLFVVEALGTPALKGIERPLQLFRVIQPTGVRGRLEAAAAARGLTPFVGREDELRSLMSRWERALEGEGQVVLIIGEAGIGKSRLVQRFNEQIVATPHTWLQSAAGVFFQNTPFFPIAEMLKQALAWRADESAEQQLTQLGQALELAGLKPSEAIPLIAPLLNLPPSEKYPPSALSPEQQRRRLLATLVEMALGAAQVQPTAIATEDLHWADPSTLELIQLLVEQGARAPLLLLYTARPEFRALWPPREHHTQITLKRLGSRDVRTLVQEVAARKALSDETVAAVVERTAGVPLFVEELTRAVLESGDTKTTGREIPVTLHDSLMARLDRLGPAKEVIQIGAVIGSEFSYELLRAVHPIAEADLQRALRALANAELLYVRGIAPEATYLFKHALIRDTAYEALLKSRRKDLHRLVARAIDEKVSALKEGRPEVLARHWTEAGETESAIAAWSTAGKTAELHSAFIEAQESYQAALALFDRLPESSARDIRELELRQAAVQMLWVTRGYSASATIDATERLATLAEKSGKLAQLVRVMVSRSVTTGMLGDLTTGGMLDEQLLRLAVREGSPTSLGLAHFRQVLTRSVLGDLTGSEEHFIAWLKFFDDPGYRQSLPGAAVIPVGFACSDAWILGRADLAQQREIQMMAVANKDNPYEQAFSALFAANLRRLMRDYAQAETLAARALEVSEKNRFPFLAAYSRCVLGHAQAQLGRATEGVALTHQALAGVVEIGAYGNVSRFTAALAAAQQCEGAIVQALATVEQALEANPDELLYRPETLSLRAELRLKQGQRESAEADFREAIELARRIAARGWELRATMSLARLLDQQGRRGEARSMLAEIYGWFTEGFDTADLKDAKALLDELGR
jgi:class 3 adenylate cyclase/tetratricopeptide (TPR) repeat protein